MPSTPESNPATRSDEFYLEDGDVIVRVEGTLYRFHSYHLQRATAYFDKLLDLTGDVNEDPLLLDDVRASDFEGLLWFFYESGYTWQGLIKGTKNIDKTWKSVLLLAEKFSMVEIAKVACYALHRNGAPLGDARKIELCMRYGLPDAWMDPHLKRVLTREESLSAQECGQLGFAVTALLAKSREQYHHAQMDGRTSCPSPAASCSQCTDTEAVVCLQGLVHLCDADVKHHWSCPERASALPLRTEFVKDIYENLSKLRGQLERVSAKSPPSVRGPEQGDTWFIVENTVFRLHSFHLIKASPVFATMFTLAGNTDDRDQGHSPDDPIRLRGDTAKCMDSMLWFFYDSPYEWSEHVAPEMANKWEFILQFAKKYDMADVCKVAVTALNHHGVLSPVRKISLADVHGMGDAWAKKAYDFVCQRDDSLTVDEMNELGTLLTVKIVKAREQRLRSRLAKGGKVSWA